MGIWRTMKGIERKMGTTSYHSINGQVIGRTAGSTRAHFLTDALGSVTAMVSEVGSVQNTYRFKAYGGLMAKTGVFSDPPFLWVGSRGYRISPGSAFSYVRARHYSKPTGAWLTVDQLVPIEPPYSYSRASPTTRYDPSGFGPDVSPNCKGMGLDNVATCCADYKKTIFDAGGNVNQSVLDSIMKCLSTKGGAKWDPKSVSDYLKRLLQSCDSKEARDTLCIVCPKPSELPGGCEPCKSGTGAHEIVPFDDVLPPLGKCFQEFRNPDDPCWPLHIGSKCGCTVVWCAKFKSDRETCEAMLHELIHCSGSVGGPHHDKPPYNDGVYALACCICQAMNPDHPESCLNCKGFGAK